MPQPDQTGAARAFMGSQPPVSGARNGHRWMPGLSQRASRSQGMFEMTERTQRLKDDFIRVRGYWNEFWDGLLQLSPDFFEAYLNLSSVPWTKGVLDPKVREFIYIAIDASTTHLYEPGLRIHIQNALRLGATKEEIMEVYQLTSVLGMHTCTFGVPVLLDEFRQAGRGAEVEVPFDDRRLALKEDFIAKRGYWNAFWDGLLALDPDFFDAYLRFSSVPWTRGVLEPKIKEFIYIAIDAATTHLYEPGLRIHIQNALKYGATKEEIMEVYQLTTALGMHTCTLGVPVLLDELEKRERGGTAPAA
ncbi:carboxymuconolactone decarboxylase family protein [Azospirillum canadense]|uniref:carboxymuconolactone decarboxylase family protein n=1 Tax=Azospirillum canadense TaxID=403962 RepID=UPI0022264FE7|nr:carboxymuconolactone decarboxylase family protein [Azospirillum canadense]MCW2241825.1 alkylhydroperoxidase/carboxymuconolactone decarboxylase family protein YurZ [Azospirillum canadense]